MLDIKPITLTGTYVQLEPLQLEHSTELSTVGLDPQIWEFMTTQITNEAEMRAYNQIALDEQARGLALPFATRDLRSNQLVGSTRFGNIAPQHRRVEIGWTWIAPAWQRTAINTEAKYLMLEHAFEVLGCIRVELKTDLRNIRSQNAMKRIGAKQEGILRQYMILDSGYIRDTVYFSIIDTEWPRIKADLQVKLAPRS